MKVILRERVPSLGNVGEIVNVSPGYARNSLFPKNLAVLADEGNQKFLENQKKALAKKVAEERSAAEELKGKIEGVTIELLKRVAGNGKLFGTVNAAELSKELEKKGAQVEKRLIQILDPIKNLGNFEVKVKLFQDVEATFSVKVEMDLNQQKELQEKQKLAAEKKARKAAEPEAEATTEEASPNDDAVDSEAEQNTEA